MLDELKSIQADPAERKQAEKPPLRLVHTQSDAGVVRRTIRAYDSALTRFYCRGRFQILRQRFLQEIGQYLPESGDVLDVGCGFGLFSLYYAQVHSNLKLHGMDLNPRRIAQATKAAGILGVTNATYVEGDARSFEGRQLFDGAYMLDIVHHIPPDSVKPLMDELHASLKPGACLVIKDVESRPAYKRWFTFALDKLIDPHTPVHYWEADTLKGLVESAGFRVYCHAMLDYMPYPHVIYVCWKR